MEGPASVTMVPRMEMAASRARSPLYLQLYDEIAAQIASGSLRSGDRLPPERQLCVESGVSRATVRRALAALEADGLVQAVQGRGTFVTSPRLAEPPNTLLSFTQLAAARGASAGARVLLAEVRTATLDEAERFRIAPGSEVFELERLRTMDGLPVALDHSTVPLSAAPGLTDADWEHASLYALLREAESAPIRADYALEARAADARCAQQLELAVGAPVLVAETAGYTRNEQLVEIGRIVYRGDRYRFRSTLSAQPPGPSRSAHELPVR